MTRHSSINAPSPPPAQSDSPERSDGAYPDDLGTTTLRVRWLVETRFRGNRSAFAAAIGLTHSAVARVFKDRAPGRKMLEAIVANLQVSSEWLISGLGQPFRQPTAVAPRVWDSRFDRVASRPGRRAPRPACFKRQCPLLGSVA